MADNATVDNGTLTDFVVAADDVGSGVLVQRVKQTFGVDGVATDVSTTNPLPVGESVSVAQTTFTATDIVVPVPPGTGVPYAGTPTAGSVVALAVPDGMSASNILVLGQTTGAIYFEGSTDSTNGLDGNWTPVKHRLSGTGGGIQDDDYFSTQAGYYRSVISGYRYVRARHTGTRTGTPSASIWINSAPGAAFLAAGLPTSSAAIGTVDPTRYTATPTMTTSALATTSATVAAADANRKLLVIVNVGDYPCWITDQGGAAVVDTGILLNTGDSWVEDKVPTLAWTGIAEGGATRLTVRAYT